MTCYDDEPTPAQRRVYESQRPQVNWRASAWLLVVLFAIIGLLILASGCSPLRGPATSVARPEPGLATIAPAAAATQGELATVCTSTTAIRQEVAAMVPSVRQAARVAPEPAARIEAGHQTIYGAAQAAEQAAGAAKAQVETITASASQAEKELARLRSEIDGERADMAKERQEWQERDRAGMRWVVGALYALGALGILGGIVWVLVLRRDLSAGAGLATAGAASIGAGELLSRYGQWLGIAVAVLFAAAAIVGIILAVRKRDKQQALTDASLAGAVGFGEQVKAGAPAEVVADAKAWAKANLPKEIRDRIWQELPNESARK